MMMNDVVGLWSLDVCAQQIVREWGVRPNNDMGKLLDAFLNNIAKKNISFRFLRSFNFDNTRVFGRSIFFS